MIAQLSEFFHTPTGIVFIPVIAIFLLFVLGDLIKWFRGGK